MSATTIVRLTWICFFSHAPIRILNFDWPGSIPSIPADNKKTFPKYSDYSRLLLILILASVFFPWIKSCGGDRKCETSWGGLRVKKFENPWYMFSYSISSCCGPLVVREKLDDFGANREVIRTWNFIWQICCLRSIIKLLSKYIFLGSLICSYWSI